LNMKCPRSATILRVWGGRTNKLQKIDANTFFGFWPKRRIEASVESLLGRMDRAGIDAALTYSAHGLLNDFKEGNDQTQKVCSESDGRLIPTATINPQTYFGIFEEVERIVANGFKIVRFFPVEQEWAITERHFVKLLEKIAQTELVVMLPSTSSATTIAAVCGGMGNPVIIESVRAYVHLAEIMITLQENKNIYLETHLIGGLSFIEMLCQEVGSEQLIFGTGAPLQCIGSSVGPVESADISEAEKDNIFRKNITRLLKL